MTGHDGRRRPDHDWRKAGACGRCGGAVVEMRRAGSYARQVEHRERCRDAAAPVMKPESGGRNA